VYQVQSDDAVQRAWRRTRKLKARLATGQQAWDGFTKPKGMHWVTFERIKNELIDAEMRRNLAIYQYLKRVLP
jgi:hypothetical protein